MTKTDLQGQVIGVYANHRPDTLETIPAQSLTLTFAGVEGDKHGGLQSKADGRYPFYERGTPILNTRQVSLVSMEELGSIQYSLKIDYLVASWLGANISVMGIPNLSLLPIGSRLFFAGGAVLLNMGYNPPCTAPGHIIHRYFEEVAPNQFPKAAHLKRGIVAMVEREGQINAGDEITVSLPTQPPYPDPNALIGVSFQ